MSSDAKYPRRGEGSQSLAPKSLSSGLLSKRHSSHQRMVPVAACDGENLRGIEVAMITRRRFAAGTATIACLQTAGRISAGAAAPGAKELCTDCAPRWMARLRTDLEGLARHRCGGAARRRHGAPFSWRLCERHSRCAQQHAPGGWQGRSSARQRSPRRLPAADCGAPHHAGYRYGSDAVGPPRTASARARKEVSQIEGIAAISNTRCPSCCRHGTLL